MRIAINGAGVAGPTLAWWLKHYGHTPTLFEKSPVLRTGGYLIDFWGIGYDVAERMGLLPVLREKGYLIESLRFENARGRTTTCLNVKGFREFLHGRMISIARGDIASTIYHACGRVETRFNATISKITQQSDRVAVRISDGSSDEFDLVVGADGLHSEIRSLCFGPESRFERRLGCHVAVFTLANYQPRDELIYVGHTAARRMVARVSLRNDLTLFLFVFRSELLRGLSAEGRDTREILRFVFDDMKWEVPAILPRLDEVDEIYFDSVDQILMNRWSDGRIALIGDAAACVSFLAGEGTGLAMAEAYTLAGEIHRANGDHAAAFRRYEEKLRPLLSQKQTSALKMVNFFAPSSRFPLFVRDLGLKAATIPYIARKFIGGFMREDFQLANYED